MEDKVYRRFLSSFLPRRICWQFRRTTVSTVREVILGLSVTKKSMYLSALHFIRCLSQCLREDCYIQSLSLLLSFGPGAGPE